MKKITNLSCTSKTVLLFKGGRWLVEAGLNSDNDGDIIVIMGTNAGDHYIGIPKDQKSALRAALLKQAGLDLEQIKNQDSQIMEAFQVLFRNSADHLECFKAIRTFLTENNIEFDETFWGG